MSSIGQNVQPFTGHGDVSMSEEFSSGTKNPKQTHKQTRIDIGRNRSLLAMKPLEIIPFLQGTLWNRHKRWNQFLRYTFRYEYCQPVCAHIPSESTS